MPGIDTLSDAERERFGETLLACTDRIVSAYISRNPLPADAQDALRATVRLALIGAVEKNGSARDER